MTTYIFERIRPLNTFEANLMLDTQIEENDRVYILHLARSSVHNQVVHYFINQVKSHPQKHVFIYEIEKDPNSDLAHNFLNQNVKSYDKKVKRLVKKLELELLQLLH